MNPGQKHYIKLFGFRILKIKAININCFDVYLFFIPFITIRTFGRNTNINMYFIQKIYEHFKKYYRKIKSKQFIKAKKQIKEKFKEGQRLKICLLTSRPGMWNFDYLYKILKNDARFETIPVIMPDPCQGRLAMLDYLKQSSQELIQKGLNPICGYDFNTNKILNFKKEINPDIIIYSDFWKPHICNEFYITEFLDKITILNDYGFSVMQDEKTCNWELNNLVDLYTRETVIHKNMAEKLMDNNGKNVVIVGSPQLDPIFDPNYNIKDPWKQQTHSKKRIIWAPHHSRYMPNDMYCCNAFWEIYNEMLNIADKYKDEIQIAFRPHPMLREKIKQAWGEYITNEYFKKWETLENTQISSGDFIDLFLTSDAMIMDSCSFLAEYTAFDKPLFYTRTSTSRLNLNEFGEKLFEHVYDTEGDLVLDIENFIKDVVINGNDYKKEGRTKFVQKYFGKINGKTASENIYDEIITFLEKGDI